MVLNWNLSCLLKKSWQKYLIILKPNYQGRIMSNMIQEPKNWIGKKFALMDILLNSAKSYGISSKIEFADSGTQCVNFRNFLQYRFYVKPILKELEVAKTAI